MLPNRESGPQNQPSAKVAVSILAGAEASIGGIGTEFALLMAIVPLSFAPLMLSHASRNIKPPQKRTIAAPREKHLLKPQWSCLRLSSISVRSDFLRSIPKLLHDSVVDGRSGR